jgi:hypothetical protein
MKNLLGGLLLVLSISVSGQISDPIALLNTVHETTGSIPDTAKSYLETPNHRVYPFLSALISVKTNFT